MQKRKIWRLAALAVVCVALAVSFTWVCAVFVSRSLHTQVQELTRDATTVRSRDELSTRPENVITIPISKEFEGTLRKLVENNIQCVSIFVRNGLPVNKQKLHSVSMGLYTASPVQSERIQSMHQLRDLVERTYVELEANTLLQGNFENTNRPLYNEIGGVFCRSDSFTPSKSQNLRWGNYSIDVVALNQESCMFHIDVMNWSSTLNRYVIRYPLLRAQKQNGSWRLEQLYTGYDEENFMREQAQSAYLNQ